MLSKTPEFTTFTEEVETLVKALRSASSIAVIERALDIATGPGDDWPQGGQYPNPAFTLAMIQLLKRDAAHKRYAISDLTGEEHA